MRFQIALLMMLAAPLPLEAQTINGESNYEDGFSHITPDEADARLREDAKRSSKDKTQDARPRASDKQ